MTENMRFLWKISILCNFDFSLGQWKTYDL